MICDWDMPRLNGLLTLLNLRNKDHLADLPCLMIGAQAEERNLAEILGPDEDGCLSKPFSTLALEEKMFEILFKKMPPSPIDPHMRAAGPGHCRRQLYHRSLPTGQRRGSRTPQPPGRIFPAVGF